MFTFSCEKAFLSSAVSTVSRAVAPRSSIPSLEGILISVGEKIILTGYNQEIGIKTIIPGSVDSMGAAVIDPKLFGEIVRKLPDDLITLKCDEKLNVTIESGMSKFSIMAMPAEDYPPIEEVKTETEVTLSQSLLKSMISETVFAVSDNQARPIHTGSLFELESGILTVVSVDGYRLALRKENLDVPSEIKQKFVVPGVALSEVEKICLDSDDPVVISLDDKHICFKINDTVLISRQLEGEFLNYKKAIPRNNPIIVVINRKDIISSIERVALLINDKTKTPVKFKFDDGVVYLNTNSALGTASDICKIEGNGDGLEIGFNDKYVLDALKNTNEESVKIELNTSISPAIITDTEGKENFIYMVLPVRLK